MVAVAEVVVVPPPPQPPTTPPSALVERERELAALGAAADQAATRSARLVLITGEAGTGKTALWTHFVRALESARAKPHLAWNVFPRWKPKETFNNRGIWR